MTSAQPDAPRFSIITIGRNDLDGLRNTSQSIVTQDFLNFTYNNGNDLITPRDGFPGLKPGDRWCLCLSRWIEAYYNGVAPLIDLERTHYDILKHVELDILVEYGRNN